MSVFDKITHIVELHHNNNEETVKKDLMAEADKRFYNYIMPIKDNTPKVEVIFPISKEVKHLKKLIWKHYRYI